MREESEETSENRKRESESRTKNAVRQTMRRLRKGQACSNALLLLAARHGHH